ncbi:ATP-grasp domain-containing protein [Sphingomonas sp. HF-S3]|uniref:ATP-grasp domain-containing protein n=1 Tax=Sphingomonas rustica TaxID=3103142 RepID=A0ABV0BFF6_9SPHN
MPRPYAIFCSDPLDPRKIEPDFAAEAEIAEAAGFTLVRLDHDQLDHRIDAGAALRKARFDEPGKAIYRGWMLSAQAYAALHAGLLDRGIELITTPAHYDACHHAPGSYDCLSSWMPRMAWLGIDEIDDRTRIDATLASFGGSPLVIKDWVKSQAAGYWHEACYIADASEPAGALRVLHRFRELQGDSLVGGIVFKTHIPLVPHGSLAHEYRAFVVGGRSVGCWPRSEAAAELGGPPSEMVDQIAVRMPGIFASADFGQDLDGRWWLLEVGDGQVSGLPVPEAALPIFTALRSLIR